MAPEASDSNSTTTEETEVSEAEQGQFVDEIRADWEGDQALQTEWENSILQEAGELEAAEREAASIAEGDQSNQAPSTSGSERSTSRSQEQAAQPQQNQHGLTRSPERSTGLRTPPGEVDYGVNDDQRKDSKFD